MSSYFDYCCDNSEIDKNTLLNLIREHFSKTKLHKFISNVICSNINQLGFDDKIIYTRKNDEFYTEYGYDNKILYIQYDDSIIIINSFTRVEYLYIKKPNIYNQIQFEFSITDEQNDIGHGHIDKIIETDGYPIECVREYFKWWDTTIKLDAGNTIELYRNNCNTIKKTLNTYLLNDIIDIILSYTIEKKFLDIILSSIG